MDLALCECGCDQQVSKKGKRFVFGHHHRMRFPLCECGCGQHVARKRSRFVTGHNMYVHLPLCECGCGERVTRKRNKYITGHNWRGKKRPGRVLSERHKRRIGIASKRLWQLEEYQKKVSQGLRGENNPNWRGGVTYELYGPGFTDILKLKIRARDGFRCRKCGRLEKQEQEEFSRVLSIHHIDYSKDNHDEDNLITLCDACNSGVNYNRNYWQSFFNNLIAQNQEARIYV